LRSVSEEYFVARLCASEFQLPESYLISYVGTEVARGCI